MLTFTDTLCTGHLTILEETRGTVPAAGCPDWAEQYNPGVDLNCPACSAPALQFDGDSSFACEYCGITLVAGRIECPACGERNPRAAEQCQNCGEPLSIVASIIDRQGSPGPPLWMRRLRSQVGDLKLREEQASQTRLAAFQEVDRRRIAHETAAHARQQARDSNLLFYGLIGVLAVVLLGLVLAALL